MKKKKIILGIALLAVTFAACPKKPVYPNADPETDFQAVETAGGMSVEITKYLGKKWMVVIPSKIQNLPVAHIGDFSFYGKNIVKVTMPDTVTTIGRYAFSGNQLTSVTIPNSVTLIDQFAFENNKLTSVTLPNSAVIGSYAFVENELTGVIIPDGVTAIGNYAFIENQLTSITIPKSVTRIGYGFDYNNEFALAYNKGGAGTYTRPNIDTITWTKQ